MAGKLRPDNWAEEFGVVKIEKRDRISRSRIGVIKIEDKKLGTLHDASRAVGKQRTKIELKPGQICAGWRSVSFFMCGEDTAELSSLGSVYFTR